MRATVRRQITELAVALRDTPHEPGSHTFGPIMDRFYDLAEELALSDLGEPTTAAMVAAYAEQTFRCLHPGEGAPLMCRAFRLPELGFVHGAAVHPNHGVAFFWFDALQQGMAAIMDLQTAVTEIARMTSTLPTDPGEA